MRYGKKFIPKALLLVIVLLVARAVEPAQLCAGPSAIEGAWSEVSGETQILFEADRIVVREDGRLRAARILQRDQCLVIVRDQGIRSTWRFSIGEQGLRMDRGKGVVLLARLQEVPASLDIRPLALPVPGPVPAEVVQEIAVELKARAHKDQKMAVSASEQAGRPAVLAENCRYLRETVGRYGWIDIPRFGKAAAAAAIMIAKHGSDVPLLQAALHMIEKDARENGGGRELVAISVDDVLVMTGHKQKYGTQMTEDKEGKPFVIPVEDLAKVEEHRRELGISPWAEYLKLASQYYYKGAPIRIPGPDE